jgi:hypothetical protein
VKPADKDKQSKQGDWETRRRGEDALITEGTKLERRSFFAIEGLIRKHLRCHFGRAFRVGMRMTAIQNDALGLKLTDFEFVSDLDVKFETENG